MFVLNDPFLRPDSATIKTLIKHFYPISFPEIMEKQEKMTQHTFEDFMQKSYFESRIKVLADFANINLRNRCYLNKEDLTVNYMTVFKSLRDEEVNEQGEN